MIGRLQEGSGTPSAPSRGGLEGDVRWPAPSTEELSCEFLDEPLLVVVDRPAGLDDELLVDADGSEGTVDRPGCREGGHEVVGEGADDEVLDVVASRELGPEHGPGLGVFGGRGVEEHHDVVAGLEEGPEEMGGVTDRGHRVRLDHGAVSYTHLTLPTILRV